MSTDSCNEPTDGLRTIEQLNMADARMQHIAIRDNNSICSLTQDDRYAAIHRLELHASVPLDIRVQFDTARNCYLYAWFVYRFHVVAEQHALGTLEFALRTALESRSLISQRTKSGVAREVRGLKNLLVLAAKHGLISNDRLPFRIQWASVMARQRSDFDPVRFMSEHNIDTMVVPDAPPVPTPEEINFDWIRSFCETLPQIRNNYAHGGHSLHAGVLRTFQVVWSLVNQLFTDHQSWSGTLIEEPDR